MITILLEFSTRPTMSQTSANHEAQPLIRPSEFGARCVALAKAAGRVDIAEESQAVAAIVEDIASDPTLIDAAFLSALLREGLAKSDIAQHAESPQLPALAEQLQKMHELVTKQARLASDNEGQTEALRRLLLAIVSDIRLIVIRLAEVLYALRCAKSAAASEREKLARNVMNLYAPLANRLGVWQLKWELEDLSFRYLQPDQYKAIATALKARRQDREKYLADFQKTLADALQAAGISGEVSGRPKHIYSIHRKLTRKQVGVDALADLRAVRIMVDDVTACYAALGVVHNLWTYLPREFDDYIANPKPNNYRSLHTAVVGPEQLVVEVQIRTHDMHAHAELGVAAHWRYKEGGQTQPAFEQKIRWLRQLLEPGEDQSNDLLTGLQEEVLEDRVYAISPRGDIVDLPAGATPLDFAYQVHTMIGHRCRGAKVNGRIATLTDKLENGDQVEIITSKEPQPSRDWLAPRLGFLASARNRAKVRSWFKQQDRDINLKHGKESFEREIQRLGRKEVSPTDVAKHLKFDSPDSLYVALGAGDLTPGGIATAIQHLVEPPQRVSRRRKRKPKTDAEPATTLVGVDDLLSQFARCCRPLPPDEIGGYITQGRGISIHRRTCGNFRRLAEETPARVVRVGWSTDAAANYTSTLHINALDQAGILRDVGAIMADEDITITATRSSSESRTGRASISLTIEVSDLPTLSRAMVRVEALPYVLHVRRES